MFGLVPSLLSIIQFFLQHFYLLLGHSKLILGLTKLLTLSLNLPFCPFQSNLSVFLLSLNLGELGVQLLDPLLNHVKGLNSYNTLALLILHLSVIDIHQLLSPKSSLNSLQKKKM